MEYQKLSKVPADLWRGTLFKLSVAVTHDGCTSSFAATSVTSDGLDAQVFLTDESGRVLTWLEAASLSDIASPEYPEWATTLLLLPITSD